MKNYNEGEVSSGDDTAAEKQLPIETHRDEHYPLAADSTGSGDPEWLEMYFSIQHSDHPDEIHN